MIPSVVSQSLNGIFYFFSMLYYTFMLHGPHTLVRPLSRTDRESWIIHCAILNFIILHF